ncbi:snare region anchored in the vesicle membrane C-terminus-domain-containing protein [Halteromyces radiatus]|uniref:snare region anchored in the vesicle membrane C-terminus-domain-containing protein n=1 Tax=Halteromyces radiatus TaxID=101107 RepID=UPI00221F21F1|nr:snare region anchored in the vesicle membrane C-terminus-domain-containing protein [Halteromyces radiatus]KAI8084861.1 snare region anchored in the vesicle membrane C-terminus-domain-containing protein [Halteromyces radiatus]
MVAENNEQDHFSGYEQDFYSLQTNFNKTIDTITTTSTADKRKTIINTAERELSEANDIIGQMERELINAPTPSRVRLQARLRLLKSEGEKMKRDLRRASLSPLINQDREDLLLNMNPESDLDASTIDQRQRLLNGTERLGESSRRLEGSHRLALETENIGVNILSTLKGQRETLLRTRDTLGEADSYIDKSSRTLKVMARRMATNKIIIGIIILVLVALIVLIVWSKLF